MEKLNTVLLTSERQRSDYEKRLYDYDKRIVDMDIEIHDLKKEITKRDEMQAKISVDDKAAPSTTGSPRLLSDVVKTNSHVSQRLQLPNKISNNIGATSKNGANTTTAGAGFSNSVSATHPNRRTGTGLKIRGGNTDSCPLVGAPLYT